MSASANPFPPTRATSRAASLGVLAAAGLAVLRHDLGRSSRDETGTTVLVTVGTPKETSVKLSKSSGLPAGSVVFQVTNRGKAQHTFVVCSKPVSGLVNSCTGKSVTLTKTGQTAKLTVTSEGQVRVPLDRRAARASRGRRGRSASVSPSRSRSRSIPKSGGTDRRALPPVRLCRDRLPRARARAGTGSGTAGGLPVFPDRKREERPGGLRSRGLWELPHAEGRRLDRRRRARTSTT